MECVKRWKTIHLWKRLWSLKLIQKSTLTVVHNQFLAHLSVNISIGTALWRIY